MSGYANARVRVRCFFLMSLRCFFFISVLFFLFPFFKTTIFVHRQYLLQEISTMIELLS